MKTILNFYGCANLFIVCMMLLAGGIVMLNANHPIGCCPNVNMTFTDIIYPLSKIWIGIELILIFVCVNLYVNKLY